MQKFFSAVIAVVAFSSVGCGLAVSESALSGDQSALCSQGLLGQAINSTGKVPDGCVKIEGGEIGEAPQTLEVDGVTVTITSWELKEGSGGEYIGFSFTEAGGSVTYAVKAGTRTFAGDETSWVHPEGTRGSSAKAISNITFCVDDEEENTPSDGGTTDDGEENGGGECGGGNTDGGSDDGELPGDPTDAGTVNGPQGPGEGCEADVNCRSGVCTDGICEASPGGGACNLTSDCLENYSCEQGICVPTIG